MRFAVLIALAVAGLGAAATLAPAATRTTQTLHASVGPGYTISLTTDTGAAVRTLPAGDYTVEVEDEADIHDFHLSGPGVDQATSVEGTGREVWNVTLRAGTYTYRCDPHASTLHGSFQVTDGTAPATTATTPKPKPSASKVPTLAARVGPGFTISLRSSGKVVKRLKAGRYRFVIVDRSAIHNFALERLSGGHFRRNLTGIPFVGRATVVVRLAPGRWTFYCAAHRSSMVGVFRVG